jgi:hypothetical protein
MKEYFDTYYKCSVLILEDNLMQIGEKVIIKHNSKVIECRVFKIFDLNYGSSDELVLIDEQGNEYTRHYWEVNKLTKTAIKELDPDKVKSTEIEYKPIIEPIKESEEEIE